MPEDDGEPGKGASPEPAKSPSLRHVSHGLASHTIRPSVPLERAREALPLTLGTLLVVQDPVLSPIWWLRAEIVPREHFSDS